MKPNAAAMDNLWLGAKLADLKEEHYKHTLLLAALLELLGDKGLIAPHELEAKMAQLDLQGAMEASWAPRQPGV